MTAATTQAGTLADRRAARVTTRRGRLPARPDPAARLPDHRLAALAVPGAAWAVLNSVPRLRLHRRARVRVVGGLTLQNYVNAWQQADFATHFCNSVSSPSRRC